MLEGTPNLRNGFYIEAGAYDGLKFSNSLLFEMRCVMSPTARVGFLTLGCVKYCVLHS